MTRIIFIAMFCILLVSGCATNNNIESNNTESNTWTNELIKKSEQIVQPKKDLKVYDDLWERIRLGFDIQDPNLDIIDRHVRQLKSNPAYVDRLLERSSSYLFYIIEEVEARDSNWRGGQYF